MVLDMPGGLFGDKNPLTDEERRVFTLMRPQKHQRIAAPGWAVIGSAIFPAGGIQNYKREMGFATSISLMNASGATRNSTIVIENLTSGVTLLSGNVDLADGEILNTSFSWSLEDIKQGDRIKFTIGNEGVGTATAAGSETKYWNCSGLAFLPAEVSGTAATRNINGAVNSDVDETKFHADIQGLPDGVTVIAAKVYGAATGEQWFLRRRLHTSPTSGNTMATTGIGNQDTSITSGGVEVIDNANYRYYFDTTPLDTNEDIYGARITYTAPTAGSDSTLGYYEFQLNGFFKSVGETSNE